MRKFFPVIIISIILFSCSSKYKKIPSGILPVDTMKVVVWHMIEAGDYATSLKEKDSSIKSLNTAYFSEVLKLHHLDKKNFLESFNFYQSNPYFNNILFDSVNAYASRQRMQIYKLRQ